MKWSWKIGSFAGIGVFIHATFLLILIWVGFLNWQQTQSLAGTLEGIFFTLALFGCVVLHEFGHALTAKRYGIRTRDITLYPIGGVARLERMPEKPIQELWVALAGPTVNIVIAMFFFGWLVITGTWTPLSGISTASGSFIERLMLVNISLVLFNMVPAFPMDGGRVLRSLLALRLEYTIATQIAATIGQGMALLFGFAGFFINPFLLLIALFVWIGASQEFSMVKIKSTLSGIPTGQAIITDFQVLSPHETLGRAIQPILNNMQTDVPVVKDKTVLGMLRRNDIFTGLSRYGKDVPVINVMNKEFSVVDVNEMLDVALLRLQMCNCNALPVTYHGQLVGLITAVSIGEFLKVQSTLDQSSPSGKFEARNA